eukprot:1339428-Pleurochrysis_carterae.AAC.1
MQYQKMLRCVVLVRSSHTGCIRSTTENRMHKVDVAFELHMLKATAAAAFDNDVYLALSAPQYPVLGYFMLLMLHLDRVCTSSPIRYERFQSRLADRRTDTPARDSCARASASHVQALSQKCAHTPTVQEEEESGRPFL